MMPKGVPKGTDPKIQGASRRAQLVSMLSQAEAPMTIAEIQAATGWGESGVAYTATKAAESGLIKMVKKLNKNYYYVGNVDQGDESAADEVVGEPTKRKTRIVSAKEVELVVAGVLVILGRNPTSGRLRIVLEEM